MTEQQARLAFQAHLTTLGYQIEQDNPVFDNLFDHYKDGTLYQEYQTEFLPVLLWNKQAEKLLEPYKKYRP